MIKDQQYYPTHVISTLTDPRDWIQACTLAQHEVDTYRNAPVSWIDRTFSVRGSYSPSLWIPESGLALDVVDEERQPTTFDLLSWEWFASTGVRLLVLTSSTATQILEELEKLVEQDKTHDSATYFLGEYLAGLRSDFTEKDCEYVTR
jgi:hypothetical protein